MDYHELIELARRSAAARSPQPWPALVAWSAAAHEIPTDVKINAFVNPAGHRLELLIRVRSPR